MQTFKWGYQLVVVFLLVILLTTIGSCGLLYCCAQNCMWLFCSDDSYRMLEKWLNANNKTYLIKTDSRPVCYLWCVVKHFSPLQLTSLLGPFKSSNVIFYGQTYFELEFRPNSKLVRKLQTIFKSSENIKDIYEPYEQNLRYKNHISKNMEVKFDC